MIIRNRYVTSLLGQIAISVGPMLLLALVFTARDGTYWHYVGYSVKGAYTQGVMNLLYPHFRPMNPELYEQLKIYSVIIRFITSLLIGFLSLRLKYKFAFIVEIIITSLSLFCYMIMCIQ